MAGIDLTIWIPILATWVLAIGTLAFAYWQLRQDQRLHSASTLLDLRERFFSLRIRKARKALSTWLLSARRGEEPENWEVALFFELLGSLTRSRILNKRLVRSAFGTWVTGYYTMINHPTDLFAQWRTESNDPLIFADFEWLARELIEFERRLGPSPNFDQSLLEDARYIMEGESRLDVGS